VENFVQIRWLRKRLLPVLCLLVMGAMGPLAAAAMPNPGKLAVANIPESAALALIGGALCILGLRLRRRK
jgi:hypothetical protein